MKRKRFSVEQLAAVLKQTEMGVPVAERIRKVGILEQNFNAGRSSTAVWK
jgi:putative transposase